ncbi:MAG: type II toxin-antitoxin system prevent-host-death family antitoxin [Chloroflexota bacterium]
MERIALRELRNHASRVVRRAAAGERILITVDGVPTAQIVPLDARATEPTLEELIAQGRLSPPRRPSAPAPAQPLERPGSPSLGDLVLRDRDE